MRVGEAYRLGEKRVGVVAVDDRLADHPAPSVGDGRQLLAIGNMDRSDLTSETTSSTTSHSSSPTTDTHANPRRGSPRTDSGLGPGRADGDTNDAPAQRPSPPRASPSSTSSDSNWSRHADRDVSRLTEPGERRARSNTVLAAAQRATHHAYGTRAWPWSSTYRSRCASPTCPERAGAWIAVALPTVHLAPKPKPRLFVPDEVSPTVRAGRGGFLCVRRVGSHSTTGLPTVVRVDAGSIGPHHSWVSRRFVSDHCSSVQDDGESASTQVKTMSIPPLRRVARLACRDGHQNGGWTADTDP